MGTQEKAEWIRKEIGILPAEDEKAIVHYYAAMHDFGMGLTDADDYAWLNTLLGYNIGPDYAFGIIRYLYETHDTTAQEAINAGSKAMLEEICQALGYKSDVSQWPEADPECIRYDWEEKLIEVTLYCDTTGLFIEDECDSENLTEMLFPEWLVRKWYEETADKEAYRSFGDWLENYTADDTDGLYDYALALGFTPSFGVDSPSRILTENGEPVFTGGYDECRRYGKMHGWELEGEGLCIGMV